LNFFPKMCQESRNSLKSDKHNGTVHEDRYIFLVMSCSILLRIGNISNKSCREKPITHFMFSNCYWKVVSFMI